MTAQAPEKFVSHHQKFDADGLHLFRLKGYKLKLEVSKPEGAHITSLWRGYVGKYELFEDGTLYLTKLSVFTGNRDVRFEDKDVNEKITGSFVLDFRETFMGDQLIVPFDNSKIILDKSKWIRRTGIRKDSGLINEVYSNVQVQGKMQQNPHVDDGYMDKYSNHRKILETNHKIET